MSACFSAVFEGVRHLFFDDGWTPGHYWPACGIKHSIAGRYLMAPQGAPDFEPCAECDEHAWRRNIRIDGWAARCGIGDPHFPAPTPQQGRIVPGYQSRYDASLEPPQAVGAADVPR